MRLLLVILFLFAAVAVYTDSRAGDWNDKPVICSQWDVVKNAIDNKGEILFAAGVQATKVRDGMGLSEVPAFLPMSIYVNPKTKTYTIIEFHPSYDSYCIISFGNDWNLTGEKL